jgi:hypothetical protein
MELADDRQRVVADGRFVIASARDLDGRLLVERLRMVFMKGTAPERAVRLLKRGDRLHVYGIPRLDFAEVSRRVRQSGTNPALLTGTLPYEIIIIGVYTNGKLGRLTFAAITPSECRRRSSQMHRVQRILLAGRGGRDAA